jgi:hypothetical protein
VKLLKWWRWKLEGAATKKPARRSRSARLRDVAPVQRLLPVVVASPSELRRIPSDERELDATTIVETTRGRITMRGTLSAEQLAAVVAELVRGC